MTFDAALLSAFTIVKLALATWLFSHTLPRRPSFSARFVVVLVTVGCLAAAMPIMGFSVFPTLTDDFSFVAAVLQFVAVLAVDIVLQRALYGSNKTVGTATMCGSCKRNETGCFYQKGVMCLGLVTQAGCNARCKAKYVG